LSKPRLELVEGWLKIFEKATCLVNFTFDLREQAVFLFFLSRAQVFPNCVIRELYAKYEHKTTSGSGLSTPSAGHLPEQAVRA